MRLILFEKFNANYFQLLLIGILFVWISFFPQPVQERYNLATMIFLITAFLILLIRKRGRIFKLTDWPLWAFIAIMSLDVLFAQNPNIAFKTYRDLSIFLFLVYYIVSESVSSEAKFMLFVKIICISSILVALGGIFECLFRLNPIYQYFIKNPYYERYITGFVRPMSTQFNPAPLGSYLLVSLPFSFLLFRQNKSLWRTLGAIGIVLNTVVLILTFSRGAFLGLIAMCIFYLFMQRKYMSIALLLSILLCFIFVSSLFTYPFNRFSKDYIIIGKGTAAFSSYRVDRYLMVGRIIKEHPLVGLGFQHFRLRFYEYYPHKDKVPYEVMIPDNMYLSILTETGIIGFLGFSIFIFSIFKKAQRKLKILNPALQEKEQLLLILAAFVGLLVNMAGYELFYWPNLYLYFYILIGLIEATYRNIDIAKAVER